ncbi:unnamed protein product [Camellia sinensis]
MGREREREIERYEAHSIFAGRNLMKNSTKKLRIKEKEEEKKRGSRRKPTKHAEN